MVEDKEDILKNLRDVQENIILFSGNQITPQSLEKQIDKLQQEMSALVKIIAQGGDSEFYAAKLRQLSEQKMGLTSQLQEIQKKKMADQAQEYQYQQALLYINNEENLNLTEFNDDFIRRIIEQITVLSATQIRIRFVGGYEQVIGAIFLWVTVWPITLLTYHNISWNFFVEKTGQDLGCML